MSGFPSGTALRTTPLFFLSCLPKVQCGPEMTWGAQQFLPLDHPAAPVRVAKSCHDLVTRRLQSGSHQICRGGRFWGEVVKDYMIMMYHDVICLFDFWSFQSKQGLRSQKYVSVRPVACKLRTVLWSPKKNAIGYPDGILQKNWACQLDVPH